jgi:hypothetical protein
MELMQQEAKYAASSQKSVKIAGIPVCLIISIVGIQLGYAATPAFGATIR